MLETGQEVAVALTLTNTGERAWDPARAHLSYHWLWLIPRELALRSRTLPYHEGIRTDLAGAVASTARIGVQGRVLAPSVPGLYWLQWDMVEEGVTWFAQVSPRPPRPLVVILPTPAAFFAPLPLVLAMAGTILLGVQRRGGPLPAALLAFAGSADVWWSAASLFSKQLMLFREALLEPTAVAYWLTIAGAIVPPAVCLLVMPRRARAWTLVAVGVLGTLVILGDAIYYRFFGDVLSAPALLAAHQTARIWGSIRSLLTPSVIWLVADLPFALWLAVTLRPRPNAGPAPRRRATAPSIVLATLVVAGGLLSAPRVLASTPLDQMFRARAVVEQLGPFGYHVYDAWNYARTTWLRPAMPAEQVDEARAWFAARAPLRAAAGPTFGAARGKNLIVVQVESLQDFIVDYRVDGQDVMPHLRRWTEDSLRFTNVTDQTSEGRTSDAEFVSLVSLLPLDHRALAFRHPGNHYIGLPRVLTEHGYATLSAVAFEPGFWNRRVMHPSYGFQQSLFEPDFQLTEQIGWGLDDHDFLQQMVPHLEKLPRPFAAWLITLSLHHPFEGFPDAHKVLKLGALDGTSFGNYLHTMRFFDQALDDFKAALARDGLLGDTVFVVFGDHDAGFGRDETVSKMIGIASTGIAWEWPIGYRSSSGCPGRSQSARRTAPVRSRRGRPISRPRSSRFSASIRRRCPTSAATSWASRTIRRSCVRIITEDLQQQPRDDGHRGAR